MNYELIIPIAYVLDLVFGDPRWLPHPVRGIGWLVARLESPLRRLIGLERLAGIFFALIIIGMTWGAGLIITRKLGPAASIFLIYTSLAVKDLKAGAMAVCRALETSDLDLARKNLGMIVGRDTAALNDKDIIRATVETVSENIVDGIISPLFYAFLGGAPLALAYKAVNTLDSMVGYNNDRYKVFGWASARLDDA